MMEKDNTFERIVAYFLTLGLLIWISGCHFVPKGKGDEDIVENAPAQYLFRHLMVQTRLAQSRQMGCLAFGNPLHAPSPRFLNRFDDVRDRLADLQQIEGRDAKKGFRHRRTGLPVIIYHIDRAVRLDRDHWLMEGGWFRSRKHSRKCLYHVTLKGPKYRIREIRIMDRCRHVITCHETPAGLRFLWRRLAF